MSDYPTNLTDKQWQVIKNSIEMMERKRKHSLREMINAILYITKSGCQGRMLPKEFGPWQTVYFYFRKWKLEGMFEELMHLLRGLVRKACGKAISPSVGLIDSRSVRTSHHIDSSEYGIDGGKKVKGRKEHIIVDTLGLPMSVKVHAANIHDTVFGIVPAIDAFDNYPTIERFCGDDGYRKTFENDVFEELGLGVDISKRIKPEFEVIPKRWVVERTLGWLNGSRRLAKDYEIRTCYSEAMIQVSHLHTLLKRL